MKFQQKPKAMLFCPQFYSFPVQAVFTWRTVLKRNIINLLNDLWASIQSISNVGELFQIKRTLNQQNNWINFLCCSVKMRKMPHHCVVHRRSGVMKLFKEVVNFKIVCIFVKTLIRFCPWIMSPVSIFPNVRCFPLREESFQVTFFSIIHIPKFSYVSWPLKTPTNVFIYTC